MSGRAIKFRVWAARENRWCLSGEYIGYEHGLTITGFEFGRTNLMLSPAMTSEEVERYRRESFVIEQFTGLLDKNAKEIYEGDIVRYTTKFEHGDAFANNIGAVRWDPQWAMYDFDDNGTSILDGDFVRASMEVIGNIHENPELLP
jgi:uncharacterized phage protein (TIGR01671 family)